MLGSKNDNDNTEREHFIELLTDYYETVDFGSVEIPAFIKATVVVDKYLKFRSEMFS